MATNKRKTTGRKQDNFDKAFIHVIHELQKMGHAKNIRAVEKFLKVPKQTFYQVLNGSRGIPLLHRDKILKFFTGRYNINPLFFSNQTVSIFKNDPPMFQEAAEDYIVQKKHTAKNRLTRGDMMEFEMLASENEMLREKLADRDKIIKNMQTQINSMQRMLNKLSA